MNSREIETARGLKCTVREWGSEGSPLVYFHGAGGLLEREPLLEALGQSHRVFAPEWPGYGEQETETALEDMLDFALHGWDVVRALELDPQNDGNPILVGHSMGGMIAAEMACLAPQSCERLVLIASAGLWIDEHPLPDLFATLPFELAELLFHDPAEGVKILTAGADFEDPAALATFMIRNARQLGTAGKILFPIPNRRLSKRLYRQSAPTLVVWGREDRFIPPVYAELFGELLPSAEIAWIDEGGHMVPVEKAELVANEILRFCAD
jgi:pimeloyl-ACP methyl ester carboxylesterase